ncbi:hypothetical protein OIU74_022562 [Salix koriyanagi]|uniref:LSM12 LSM domain-containing protein n=1 Tax=Salix koriyanagi TaxID=2511006 RepID=A0A9Q0WKR2_9ROSI|nr:hypothetical protein OIU74_022562 [Salix koriyanagi]
MAMESSNISSSNEDFAVGCLLSIKTTLGEEFDGQVMTFDRPSNVLVLHRIEARAEERHKVFESKLYQGVFASGSSRGST